MTACAVSGVTSSADAAVRPPAPSRPPLHVSPTLSGRVMYAVRRNISRAPSDSVSVTKHNSPMASQYCRHPAEVLFCAFMSLSPFDAYDTTRRVFRQDTADFFIFHPKAAANALPRIAGKGGAYEMLTV